MLSMSMAKNEDSKLTLIRARFYLFNSMISQTNEFKTEFESMEVNNMDKCLFRFYVSVRRKYDSFYNLKTSLWVRAADDHHLKSSPHNKKDFQLRQPCTCLVKLIKDLIPT